MKTDSRKIQKAKAGEKKITTINDIPDHLTQHIVQFLPIKDAVSTSVLSKNWKDHWTYNKTLCIDDIGLLKTYSSICCVCKKNSTTCCYEIFKPHIIVCTNCTVFNPTVNKLSEKEGNVRRMEIDFGSKLQVVPASKDADFIRFVDRVVNSRKPETFSLVIYNKRDPTHHNRWIESVIKKGVKNVYVTSEYYKLPICTSVSSEIFKSQCLEKLALVFRIFSNLKVPENMELKSLKILKLSGIFLKSSTTLHLPALEQFWMKSCIWSKDKYLTVSAPKLEFIYIHHEGNYCEDLNHHRPREFIKFNAQTLKWLKYSGCGSFHAVSLPCQTSPFSADIQFEACQGKTSTVLDRLHFLLALFKTFEGVGDAKIEGLGFDVLNEANLNNKIPRFLMLGRLKLISSKVEVVILLLQNSPNLNCLVLKGLKKFSKEILGGFEVPECLGVSLRSLQFENENKEYQQSLDLLEYLYDYGMNVEVWFSLDRDMENRDEIENKLIAIKCRKKNPAFFYAYDE